jgi:hypothetical protein
MQAHINSTGYLRIYFLTSICYCYIIISLTFTVGIKKINFKYLKNVLF